MSEADSNKKERGSDEFEEWIEKTNPSLLLHLNLKLPASSQEVFDSIKMPAGDFALIWVEGLKSLTDEALGFLDRGGSIVMVESESLKIEKWLFSQDCLLHPSLTIIRGSEMEVAPLVWKHLFCPMAYIGNLAEIEARVSSVIASASPYRDYGSQIVKNIHRNLLHTDKYIDGRDLENTQKGKRAVVFGGGEWESSTLQKVHERREDFTIIAAGSSIRRLLHEAIQPDFFVAVDPEVPMEHYIDLSMSEIALVYQNQLTHDLFWHHKGPKIWMGLGEGWKIESYLLRCIQIDPWHFEAGWNAGTFAIAFAYHLGMRDLFLVGMDGIVHEKSEPEEGEILFEGKVTRIDLAEGLKWLSEFSRNHPELNLYRSEEDLAKFTRGSRGQITLPEASSVDHTGLQESIVRLWGSSLLEKIDGCLSNLSLQSSDTHFLVEVALFESDLVKEPLFNTFLAPLWTIWSHVIWQKIPKMESAKKREIHEKIAELTFYRSVLEFYGTETFLTSGLSKGLFLWGQREGMHLKYYREGDLAKQTYYRQGLEEGDCIGYARGGENTFRVSFSEGKLHGGFLLYEEGRLKRKGNFVKGMPDGVFYTYNRTGEIIDRMEHRLGEKCGLHRICDDEGRLKEEITFHTKDLFDKRVFDLEGNPTYEGVWKEEIFFERRFREGSQPFERKGRIEEGEFSWIEN